jgi:MoxR-like ATPase
MDRFLVYVKVPYPPADNELEILRLVRSEKSGRTGVAPELATQEAIFEARRQVNNVHIAESAEQYIVDLVIATREPTRYSDALARLISVGASPRATIALDAAARSRAWLRGKDFVSPEDIQAVAPACLAHRVHLSYEAEAEEKTREDIVNAILEQVAVG